jgi:hypothetical protein
MDEKSKYCPECKKHYTPLGYRLHISLHKNGKINVPPYKIIEKLTERISKLERLSAIELPTDLDIGMAQSEQKEHEIDGDRVYVDVYDDSFYDGAKWAINWIRDRREGR